jgi:hypothetical protein
MEGMTRNRLTGGWSWPTQSVVPSVTAYWLLLLDPLTSTDHLRDAFKAHVYSLVVINDMNKFDRPVHVSDADAGQGNSALADVCCSHVTDCLIWHWRPRDL